jgi:hypothetical protein
MKGTPEEPRCGFSKRVVQALQQEGIPFRSFDILQVLAADMSLARLAALFWINERLFAWLRLRPEVPWSSAGFWLHLNTLAAAGFGNKERFERVFELANIPAAVCE